MGFFDTVKIFLGGKKDATSNLGDSTQEEAGEVVNAVQDVASKTANKAETIVDNA